MMLSRGFASEESKAAFTRAHEPGTQFGSADERFDTYYGLYISQSLRGDVAPAHAAASSRCVSSTSGRSGVGEKPSSAGARTSCASPARLVD
jgi:hypothetical protein